MMMKWNPDVYSRAMLFAAQAHEGQKIPSNQLPYIIHVVEVCMEVQNALHYHKGNLDANLMIECALLHDTIEDTSVRYEDIVSHFSQKTADGVLALTKDEKLDKSIQMMDSLERILLQPEEIRIVKIADRIVNLQPPPSYWTAERKMYYRDEALLIWEKLKGINDYIDNRLWAKIQQYKLL